MPQLKGGASPVLAAIPKGKKSPSMANLEAHSKAQSVSIPANISTEIVNRMLEAVTLQAGAICEIFSHTPGPVAKATKVRAQGGWETVRLSVCFLSDDCDPEREALSKHVWPELRARCAARRLHLIVVDAR